MTQSVFLAAQDPLTPLLATAAAGLINLGGDFVACNMLGMGIAGAALATAAAQVPPPISLPHCAVTPCQPPAAHLLARTPGEGGDSDGHARGQDPGAPSGAFSLGHTCNVS